MDNKPKFLWQLQHASTLAGRWNAYLALDKITKCSISHKTSLVLSLPNVQVNISLHQKTILGQDIATVLDLIFGSQYSATDACRCIRNSATNAIKYKAATCSI